MFVDDAPAIHVQGESTVLLAWGVQDDSLDYGSPCP